MNKNLFFFLLALVALIIPSMVLLSEDRGLNASTRSPKTQVRMPIQKSSDRFSLGKQRLARGENNELVLAEQNSTSKSGSDLLFQKPLFHLVKKSLGPLSLNEFSHSAIEVAYEEGVLESFLDSETTLVTIPVEEGKEVTAKIENVIKRGELTTTLTGRLEDNENAQVLLVFHDGGISGSIANYNENLHYELGL